MDAPIQLTTNEQGSSVVSARELYESLGYNDTLFARWSKKNIINNPFALQGIDWQQLVIKTNRGNGAQVEITDYALSTDFAERLCMLARTEKGEEVRRWFQAIKNKALQAPALTSTENLLLQLAQQQTQLLTNQQSQLAQLRADVQQLQAGGTPARSRSALPGVRPARNEPLRNAPLRAQVNQQVNAYCERFGAQQSETYRYLYNRLQTVYGLNVYMLTRRSGESLLDAVERYGYLDRLYALIMAELAYTD
ncbi:antA/AntB antirepressor family protein [Fibrella forsythiae]|uniref:AntA/AntB antirepressor family protein n=1 Tax=Fibrella forsythiae TaxID=2817061 RepID=A0ABS3JB70_9BACT|nr:antA/AntB antirepressor family protein [Fibrella forsythiae]MBO0947242.1 antA/AntB antirepressor family protein [Fibrella forsythiae]